MSSSAKQTGGASDDEAAKPQTPEATSDRAPESSGPERTDDGGLIIHWNGRGAEFDKGHTDFLDLLGSSETGSVNLEEFTEALALAVEFKDPWERGYAQEVRRVFIDEINDVAQTAWAIPLLDIDFNDAGDVVIAPESYRAVEILQTVYPDFPDAELASGKE